jgi:hypothetical protein
MATQGICPKPVKIIKTKTISIEYKPRTRE